MDQNSQAKDTEWLNGLKNKIPQYAAYYGLILPLRTHKSWKWTDGKRSSTQMVTKKRAGWHYLISDKIDFESKESHIMIKGLIYQEDTTTVTIYAPNIGGPKCIK